MCTARRHGRKWKPTHSLRRRGYSVGPTQKYKLGLKRMVCIQQRMREVNVDRAQVKLMVLRMC